MACEAAPLAGLPMAHLAVFGGEAGGEASLTQIIWPSQETHAIMPNPGAHRKGAEQLAIFNHKATFQSLSRRANKSPRRCRSCTAVAPSAPASLRVQRLLEHCKLSCLIHHQVPLEQSSRKRYLPSARCPWANSQ